MAKFFKPFFEIREHYLQDSVFGILASMVFLVPLVFTMNTNENFETVKFSFLMIFTGCALAVWIYQSTKPNKSGASILINNFIKILALFVLTGLIVAVTGSYYKDSWLGTYPRYTSGFLFYLTWGLSLFLLYQNLDRKKIIFLFKILIFDAVLISLFEFAQVFGFAFYGGSEMIFFERPPTFLGNSNFVAMFLAAAVPFVIVFFLESRSKQKIYYGTACLLLLAGVGFNSSRGAILGLAVGLIFGALVFLVKRMSLKYFSSFALALILSGCLFYLFYESTRPEFITSSGNSVNVQNVNTRLNAWQIAIRGMTEHPIRGAGFGKYLDYYDTYRDQTMTAEMFSFDDPHNLFLLLGINGGAVFLLLFVILVAIFLFAAYRFLLKNKDSVTIAIVASLLSLLVAGSFTPVAIPCFLFIAVVLCAHKFWTAESTPVAFKVPKIILRLVFILSILLAVFGASFLVSEHFFYFGISNSISNNQSLKKEKFFYWAKILNPINLVYEQYYLTEKAKNQGDTVEVLKLVDGLYQRDINSPANQQRAAYLWFLLYNKTKKTIYFDKAETLLQQMLKLNPYLVEKRFRLAYYYYQKGDKALAKETVLGVLILNKEFSPGWILLAKIYQEENRRDQMVYALTQLIKSRLSDSRVKPADFQVINFLKLARNTKELQNIPFDLIFTSTRSY